jgi:hypothetical protein
MVNSLTDTASSIPREEIERRRKIIRRDIDMLTKKMKHLMKEKGKQQALLQQATTEFHDEDQIQELQDSITRLNQREQETRVSITELEAASARNKLEEEVNLRIAKLAIDAKQIKIQEQSRLNRLLQTTENALMAKIQLQDAPSIPDLRENMMHLEQLEGQLRSSLIDLENESVLVVRQLLSLM